MGLYDIKDGKNIRKVLSDIKDNLSELGLGKLFKLGIDLELLNFRYGHPNFIDRVYEKMDVRDNRFR